ncbi:DUF6797 domain-containing protein [Planctomicrobium sp. SH661]|uniref:DUF6797 domain-containing protein n=1 Tax=Planctomicrobium sp. SH661 TaxID=3448124 RepID=UPI003F5C26FA
MTPLRPILLSVVLLICSPAMMQGEEPSPSSQQKAPAATPEYSPMFVEDMVAAARDGDPQRGALVFASPKFACIACHKVGEHGGRVGPDLSKTAPTRPQQHLVESVYWPRRHVEKEFMTHTVVTEDGKILKGYLKEETDLQLTLLDPANDQTTAIALDDIDERKAGETLMPEGLTAQMSRLQQQDLLCFLLSLERDGGISAENVAGIFKHAALHAHGPAKFTYDFAPQVPQHWSHHVEAINAHRLYDFYDKQADYFRLQSPVPPLLSEYPGLEGEGGTDEFRKVAKEVDPRWNETDIRPVLSGIFRADGIEVPRGVCVRLGENGDFGACFNPETLCYDAVWQGKFLDFPGARRGFMDGLKPGGQLLEKPDCNKLGEDFKYHGFYRNGNRVIFAYRIGNVEYLDAPWAEDGKFQRTVAPAEHDPLRHLIHGGPAYWPEEIVCPVEIGNGQPYAVDTIHLPFDNPRNDLLFCGGVAFLPEGAALICTMQGDVWRAEGYAFPSREVRWRKVAGGLHQAQGIVVGDDGVFVLGRDQITRLHDLNGDGEYDFHECFCNSYDISTFGHDYTLGLDRDADGNFYTASTKQGLLKISRDGKNVTVLATGFRNPDGIGVMADGTVTIPCSQGNWTPASMICAVRQTEVPAGQTPFFGFGGPRNGLPPQLPLVYLPRGQDNSSGGQIRISSDRWGPLKDLMLHFSYGMARHYLVLTDEVGGQIQGAIVPMVGDFRSGIHRGQFSPHDGQLYVAGQGGWGAFAMDDGCFERVRYTGDAVQLPIGFHLHESGIRVDFSEPLDQKIASQVANQFAQCWNYRYSAAYGSPEFSPSHPGTPGHDTLVIQSAHVLENGRSLFLEIPEIQPVNQIHLRLRIDDRQPQTLFITAHQLDQPFSRFPGYKKVDKVIQPHPIIQDLAFQTKRVPNPWRHKLENARKLTLRTAGNLQFDQREIVAKPGEVLELTFENADVVPHNWALIKPGKLEAIGQLSNQLVSDPDAYPRQYIPESDDVLAYVDIVDPGKNSTIFFQLPQEPGRYPFVCTFPGHWSVMNGVLSVTAE